MPADVTFSQVQSYDDCMLREPKIWDFDPLANNGAGDCIVNEKKFCDHIGCFRGLVYENGKCFKRQTDEECQVGKPEDTKAFWKFLDTQCQFDYPAWCLSNNGVYKSNCKKRSCTIPVPKYNASDCFLRANQGYFWVKKGSKCLLDRKVNCEWRNKPELNQYYIWDEKDKRCEVDNKRLCEARPGFKWVSKNKNREACVPIASNENC
jgi:hypothetical protein